MNLKAILAGGIALRCYQSRGKREIVALTSGTTSGVATRRPNMEGSGFRYVLMLLSFFFLSSCY